MYEKGHRKESRRIKSHVGVHGPVLPSLMETHLSDGGAELTLKDLLQRLELVTGNIARLLQLLQQLDRPGNIWEEETEREGDCEFMCVGTCAKRIEGENAPFNYINSVALTKALEQISGWHNGNRLSQGQRL